MKITAAIYSDSITAKPNSNRPLCIDSTPRVDDVKRGVGGIMTGYSSLSTAE
ncbi:hypothetical protein [Natrarchaeobius oligotrophus]|uniref:hypothetical protein n=1 Tax=Natrarchaeobius oligotrophus TaxID=3455743 RepID=UPI00140509E4|nr:hypothetical protein [Natrarchaeobius chitinivorans]